MSQVDGHKPIPRTPKCDTFFSSSFQVNYDVNEAVEFIEASSHTPFPVGFEGAILLDLFVEDATQVLSRVALGRWEEKKHSFVVPTLQLLLWRSIAPDSDQEPNDVRGSKFDAIGVGCVGYFLA